MKNYFAQTSETTVAQVAAVNGDFVCYATKQILQIENGVIVNVFASTDSESLNRDYEELTGHAIH